MSIPAVYQVGGVDIRLAARTGMLQVMGKDDMCLLIATRVRSSRGLCTAPFPLVEALATSQLCICMAFQHLQFCVACSLCPNSPVGWIALVVVSQRSSLPQVCGTPGGALLSMQLSMPMLLFAKLL